MFLTKAAEKIKTRFTFKNFSPLKIVPFMERKKEKRKERGGGEGKIWCSQTGHARHITLRSKDAIFLPGN